MNQTPQRIHVSPRAIHEAARIGIYPGTTMVLRAFDGSEEPVPRLLQGLLLEAMKIIGAGEGVVLAPLGEHLSSTEAARYLRISRSTLLNWVNDGRIDTFRAGTYARFLRDDVYRLKLSIEPEPYRSELLKELETYDPGFFPDP